MRRDTGRFAIGPRALDERRAREARVIVERHVELVLGAVEARLESGWIGDEHSPLGESRHREAVCHRIIAQRRTPAAPVTAAIVAGRHLLTIDAMCDEYFGRSSPGSTPFGEATGARRVGPATNDNGGRR